MNTLDKFYVQFEQDFFASSTIGVLVQSCIGGIAAMKVLEHGTSLFQMMQLFLVVVLAIMYNGAILSQQKPKTVFNLLLLSVTVNSLIAAYNFGF